MKYCPECGKEVEQIDHKSTAETTINCYICKSVVHWWREILDNYGGPSTIKEVT